jgi:hypothetical protein
VSAPLTGRKEGIPKVEEIIELDEMSFNLPSSPDFSSWRMTLFSAILTPSNRKVT